MYSKLVIISGVISMLINFGNGYQVQKPFINETDQFLSHILKGLQDPVTRELCTLKTHELIAYFGYVPEVHVVNTDDGYVLTMFRCNSKKQLSSKKKKVVILQHGLVSSSDEFCVGSSDQALAYVMADAGYDVWLTNNRGNFYSRRHIYKDPNLGKVGDFWNFSWDDIALHDYPAVWNYVRANTNNSKLYIIGHSQGATATMTLLSMRPMYNDYIHAAAYLSPVSYLKNAGFPWQFLAAILPALEAFKNTEFLPRSMMNNMFATFCEKGQLDFCNKFIDFLFGPSNSQRNNTLLPASLCHFPSGSSINQVIHYMKLVRHDYFGEKMVGQEIPADFPLSRITVPTIIHYTPGDTFTAAQDMHKLVSKLTSIRDLNVHVIDYTDFGHLDFAWGIHTPNLVYSQILKFFAKHQ